MRIIFVRHGESMYNAGLTQEKDVGLTKRGKSQAKYLGKRLKKLKISAIYTSRLIRARETGEIISKIIHVPIKGHFEELDEFSGKKMHSLFFRIFSTKLKRLKRFMEKFSKEKNRNKTILIVAHGITNKILIGILLQLPLKKLLRFKQHNTSLNIISWNDYYKNWNIESMNDIEHLPKRIREEYKR